MIEMKILQSVGFVDVFKNNYGTGTKYKENTFTGTRNGVRYSNITIANCKPDMSNKDPMQQVTITFSE